MYPSANYPSAIDTEECGSNIWPFFFSAGNDNTVAIDSDVSPDALNLLICGHSRTKFTIGTTYKRAFIQSITSLSFLNFHYTIEAGA